ncbi:F-box protein At3g07870-like [Primulina huaijiensis]|uniref:F-box protein At3g07870-like n=1 Tax=Primulina huaijiensis TaxID=1492673 RepID=UPI003CC7606F
MNSLPSEITLCILSRLPIRAIVSCKRVCKRWLEILSAPEFAKCHLSLSNPGLVIYQFEEDEYLCKIFEFEDVLELHNHDLHYNLVKKFDPRSFTTSPDSRIFIGGSVNGFLFLCDLSTQHSLYICNPITREYITLPQPKFIDEEDVYNWDFGFGLSSVSGQYKVVWNNYQDVMWPCSNFPMKSGECLVYTIGTGSWRSVTPFGSFQSLYGSKGVFLNGNLHWLVQDSNCEHFVSCFDLETEIFKPFSSLPSYPNHFPDSRSLSVLQDCLCLCQNISWDMIVIWTMKEYQVEESWSQQYVIPIMFQTTSEIMYPIKVFKDGDILILWENFELFFYCNKSKSTRKVDAFEMVHYTGWTEAMLHTSSFVSLRSFCGENVGTF